MPDQDQAVPTGSESHVIRRRPGAHKTKCVNGHRMTGDNVRVYVSKSGHERRICRACVREDSRARYDTKANTERSRRYRARKRAER